MNSGTLSYHPASKEWVITTTPDVTVRLKRIFPRVSQGKATELRMKETAEVANDLEWILVRFPFEMSASDVDRMKRLASAHRDKLAALDRLLTEPLTASFSLALPIREYQQLAASLYLLQGWLLLGDAVGLGKTVTAITTMTDKRTLPVVVVVKAHLQRQWMLEIKRFLPDMICHIINQNKEYVLPPSHVYIISYSKLTNWWGILSKKVRSAIYDEVQELRVTTSKKYKAASLLNSQLAFRLGMSATPIYNYGGEIWNVMNLLQPDALGAANEFNREWCQNYGGKWMVTDPDALGHHLRAQKMILRRTRKDVGRELAPIIRYVQDAEFDVKVFERGQSSADALARVILSGTFTERGQASRQFDLEMRQSTGIAKAPFVAELVRMLIDSGEKVLLAGWHRAVYQIWADRLRDLKPAFFTGHESDVQKEKARRDFIEGKTDLLIMSLRSGDGTNGLQDVCSCCVLGEMDWSPKVHEQFIGRLHRDGQKESVQVFIPVAPVGSDPTMAAVLGLKIAQSEGIMDLGVNPNPGLVETDDSRIKLLARDYMKTRGLTVNSPADSITQYG